MESDKINTDNKDTILIPSNKPHLQQKETHSEIFLDQDEAESGEALSCISSSKGISKEDLSKKKYNNITNEMRKKLIDAVENKGEKIKHAAKRLEINYSSAKSICQVFKREGRLKKKSFKKRLTHNDSTNIYGDDICDEGNNNGSSGDNRPTQDSSSGNQKSDQVGKERPSNMNRMLDEGKNNITNSQSAATGQPNQIKQESTQIPMGNGVQYIINPNGYNNAQSGSLRSLDDIISQNNQILSNNNDGNKNHQQQQFYTICHNGYPYQNQNGNGVYQAQNQQAYIPVQVINLGGQSQPRIMTLGSNGLVDSNIQGNIVYASPHQYQNQNSPTPQYVVLNPYMGYPQMVNYGNNIAYIPQQQQQQQQQTQQSPQQGQNQQQQGNGPQAFYVIPQSGGQQYQGYQIIQNPGSNVISYPQQQLQGSNNNPQNKQFVEGSNPNGSNSQTQIMQFLQQSHSQQQQQQQQQPNIAQFAPNGQNSNNGQFASLAQIQQRNGENGGQNTSVKPQTAGGFTLNQNIASFAGGMRPINQNMGFQKVVSGNNQTPPKAEDQK